jgi:hypothetical protein
MSEDESAALEQEVEAQIAAEREAFETRFPPEAFTGIATALKVRPAPENLSRLRGRLLPSFYFCLDVRDVYKEPTRKELINLLKKLSNAASTLHSAVTSADYTICLSWAFDAPDEGAVGVSDHLIATLELLAKPAAGLIEKPGFGKSRRGRPSKNEPFRQLTPTLVRIYERLRKEPAECPYWLPDSGIYSGKGDFHLFALAVWRCLQDNLPSEVRAAIPSTEGALAEELKKHWRKDRQKR